MTVKDYPPQTTDLDDARLQLAFMLWVLTAPEAVKALLETTITAFRARLAELERDER